MFYTSYFYKYSTIDKTKYYCISIARKSIEGWNLEDVCSELYPSSSLLWRYKNNEISWREYTKEYLNQLNSLDINKILLNLKKKSKGRSIVFMCWEGLGKECHRNILREFLIRKGIKCEELNV